MLASCVCVTTVTLRNAVWSRGVMKDVARAWPQTQDSVKVTDILRPFTVVRCTPQSFISSPVPARILFPHEYYSFILICRKQYRGTELSGKCPVRIMMFMGIFKVLLSHSRKIFHYSLKELKTAFFHIISSSLFTAFRLSDAVYSEVLEKAWILCSVQSFHRSIAYQHGAHGYVWYCKRFEVLSMFGVI
jgi:hypothetical protein